MHDLMRAGAIASRKNVRCAGLHQLVRDDAPIFRFHTGFFEIQRRRIGHAAQREQDFLGGNGNHFAFVFKRNGLEFSFPPCVHQLRAGEDLDAFPPENFFDFHRRVRRRTLSECVGCAGSA